MNVYELQRHFLDHMPQLRQPSMLFFVEAIGIMDMATFVRGRNTASRGIWAQMRSAQRAQQGNCAVPGGIETPTGLSRSLLHIIADIGGLPQSHRPRSWDGSRDTAAPKCQCRRGPLMSQLIAALDALCATPSCTEYSALLTKNALLYTLAAARLETYRPNGGTANARHAMDMLDEALEADDDSYNMDERARERQVEVALF
ncbi:hypothetical protein PG999_007366 [Apiospora kogelbergensis]|uniref:Uncharacterized protein n=1 Tax=Apiospora kogelbergensis TaxID=1337665 RepID=A0AAW0QY47_9PEZI